MIAVLSSQRDPIAAEHSEEGRTNASNQGAERGRSGERDESKEEEKKKRER